MSELTKRQWRLYNYLKAATGYVTQYELALNLETEYPTTQKDLQDFHNCKARKDMTADIRAINKSDVIQKMIIANSKGVKLATEAEAEQYIKARYGSIFRQLERARKIERRRGLTVNSSSYSGASARLCKRLPIATRSGRAGATGAKPRE